MVTAAMKLRHLLLESKAITNLDSALKSRHHFATMVFPLVLHRYESWTERRLSTKELMLLNCGAERLLRVPWTARRSNQSILKKINPKYSLERLMLKLKL